MKRAIPKEESRHTPLVSTPSKKVFLGGLPAEVDKEQLTACMEPFGPLVGVQIMTDKVTGNPRGFGFVIFEQYEDAKMLCDKKYIKVLVSVCVCVGGGGAPGG